LPLTANPEYDYVVCAGHEQVSLEGAAAIFPFHPDFAGLKIEGSAVSSERLTSWHSKREIEGRMVRRRAPVRVSRFLESLAEEKLHILVSSLFQQPSQFGKVD